MRPAYAAALIAAILVGIFGFGRATRFAPGDDATVRALTTEPVRVHLDYSPDARETAAALLAALEAAAATEPRQEIAAELAALATDSRFIDDVTSETIQQLQGSAAALAFSTTTVEGEGEIVTIIGITIEMLPRGRSDGISRAHEDGHAAVNNGIVTECGPEVVAFEVADGKTGNGLVRAINDHLSALEGLAHDLYHGDVREGVFGSHGRAAQRAIEALERNGCIA